MTEITMTETTMQETKMEMLSENDLMKIDGGDGNWVDCLKELALYLTNRK